ncbi:MAG TPA: acyl carrier protein [Cyanobacteria bacterium UBA8543]|nr:acyl carrier protein [Cyanobacteria bacterium UBA8543]
MNRNEMFSVLKSNIETIVEVAEGKEIKETDNIVYDLGADSLEVVAVILRTQKQLKIEIPPAKLSQIEKIKDLLDLFEKTTSY